MLRRKFLFCLFISSGAALTGCHDVQKQAIVVRDVPLKPLLTAPFRFHKLVEVSPGQYYDVLSWGRGSNTVGSFLILHSDSAAKKYTTTTGDLNGDITDVYNTDMDLDGNPEILVEAKGKDTLNYVSIYAFEFTGGRAQKIEFPQLSIAQRAGYRGNDNFYVKDGQLYREMPLYSGAGKEAKPSGEKRLFLYGLRNNTFTVKQLSKDVVIADKGKPAVTGTPVKTTAVSPQKNAPVEKKYKRKRRRLHRKLE